MKTFHVWTYSIDRTVLGKRAVRYNSRKEAKSDMRHYSPQAFTILPCQFDDCDTCDKDIPQVTYGLSGLFNKEGTL